MDEESQVAIGQGDPNGQKRTFTQIKSLLKHTIGYCLGGLPSNYFS